MKIVGKVTLKPFGTGSKSEHDAVYIETQKNSYKLRIKGGNPFNDPELSDLVGKTIKATGKLVDYLFIIDKYEIDETSE